MTISSMMVYGLYLAVKNPLKKNFYVQFIFLVYVIHNFLRFFLFLVFFILRKDWANKNILALNYLPEPASMAHFYNLIFA